MLTEGLLLITTPKWEKKTKELALSLAARTDFYIFADALPSDTVLAQTIVQIIFDQILDPDEIAAASGEVILTPN